MKQQLRAFYRFFVAFGIDPRKTIISLRGFPFYLRNFWSFRQQGASALDKFPFGSVYPCLDERFAESGSIKGHYFHQDLLVARAIYHNKPTNHVDIGSRVDGFVAHVASFRQITVIDIRRLSNTIPNITFVQADIMSAIPGDLIDYCDSLSCLHALEHFGLGRYGDPVTFDGHLCGLRNLKKILKAGGKLYLSVPFGPQRVEFNAHRVFCLAYLMERFEGDFKIDSFSYVNDIGDLHENIPLTENDVQNNFGCTYGCAIFELTKL
ncbi:MAG: DUF268 domain-containing protein [Gammaproteobacteria bacterium]